MFLDLLEGVEDIGVMVLLIMVLVFKIMNNSILKKYVVGICVNFMMLCGKV